MDAKEKVAQEVLLKATEEILGDKRKLLERKEAELKDIEEKHADIFRATASLRGEVATLRQEILEAEKIFRDVRDTQKIRRSSSACIA